MKLENAVQRGLEARPELGGRSMGSWRRADRENIRFSRLGESRSRCNYLQCKAGRGVDGIDLREEEIGGVIERC